MIIWTELADILEHELESDVRVTGDRMDERFRMMILFITVGFSLLTILVTQYQFLL